MANPFFARIGDVWKHLLLLEIIKHDPPRRYWESHAGSAFYVLSRTPDREYGIYAFLDRARRNSILGGSKFYEVISELPQQDGYPRRYPGSAAFAMLALGNRATYRLWDIDRESVRDLFNAAAALNLAEKADVIDADGIDGVKDESRTLSAADARDALVFVDPFDPFERSPGHGVSSVDLALSVASRGAKVAYWYGFDKESERHWAWKLLSLHRKGIKSAWYAEIGPAAVDAPSLFEHGMRGCGLVYLNGSATTCLALRAVARAFVDEYRDARPAHSNVTGLSYAESLKALEAG